MEKIYSSINNLQKTSADNPSVETIYIDSNDLSNNDILFKINVSLLPDGDLCYAWFPGDPPFSPKYATKDKFYMYKIPSEWVSKLLQSQDEIILTIDWGGKTGEFTKYRNEFKFILSNVYKIDLSTSFRYCYNNKGIEISKENPFCLGLELDEKANKFRIKFVNTECVAGCQCIVSLEAANGNKSIQEIKQVDCSNGAFNTNNTIMENATEIILNWKPNNFLMQEKGLVKFAFQFYRLNINGEYDFVLNTAPIYGYVHEGINAMQGIGSNIYPSEIADLYSKYNSLLSDGNITDLDSFEDVKLYLQTLVPFNIGAEIPTSEVPDNASKNQWHVLAYNPGQKRYGYVPAVMLDKEVIYGQIWNAGEYEGVELKDLPTPPPIQDATWPSSNQLEPDGENTSPTI